MQRLGWLLGAGALLWLVGCATHLAHGRFELHGVELDAPMTAAELQLVLPGMSCVQLGTDGVETCVVSIGPEEAQGGIGVSLLEGRVGAIVVQVGVDDFESLARHVTSQLGDGVETRGGAGVEGRLDQVVLTWEQDGRFVRLVKREPFDLSRSALVALSKSMDRHLGSSTDSGISLGRCLTQAYWCPGA